MAKQTATVRKSIKPFTFNRLFRSLEESLDGKSGVYSFCRGSQIEYIGFSENLKLRIRHSFVERYTPSSSAISVKVILANKSDARILESYFIAHEKPKYNGDGKYEDNPTILITPPDWSDPFKILEKSE